MKTKNGTVISGYQFSTWKVALNGISNEPCPQSHSAAAEPTKPITPKTRWPVNSSTIIVPNMKSVMNSELMRWASRARWRRP